MTGNHYFSLHKISDKIGAALVVAIGGAGFFAVPPSAAFLLTAVVTGILAGSTDAMHWLDAKWAQAITVGAMIIADLAALDALYPRIDLGAKFLASFQFVAVTFAFVWIVVALMDEIHRRAHRP